jgi:heat shock protein HslJ
MKRLVAVPLAVLASACLPIPGPPPPPYHALGTEPFWNLLIDEHDVTFTQPDAQPIRQPRPQPITGIAGETYQTPRITVNIVHAPGCSDGMSDRVYRDRVQVMVDGRRFNGCGGEAVAPVSLARTNWRVAAVNGRPTPRAGEFYMQFEPGRVGARFGCNSMGADYTQTANMLNLGPVVATQMACPDMSFEGQAGGILNQPLTMSWSGGDSLTLSNSAGRIDLTRSY